MKISSVACGLITIKMDYSVYPKSFISRINEDYVFFYSDILLKKNQTLYTSFIAVCFAAHMCYCVNILSVTPALH